MGFIIMFIKNLKGKSDKDDISLKSSSISVDLLKDAYVKFSKWYKNYHLEKKLRPYYQMQDMKY